MTQYREIFVREGIATAVKKYSWSGLRQFVTDKELATKAPRRCLPC